MQEKYTLLSKHREANHVTKVWKRVAPEPETEQPFPDCSQLEQVEAELEAMQHTGILRPKWAVGLTNQEVIAVAQHEGLNPYRPDWFDGLDPVVICEARSGSFRHGTRETITDLKNQRAKLRAELAALSPAH